MQEQSKNKTTNDLWDVVEWSTIYSTGHPDIDADHEKLFSILNCFTQAVNRGEEMAVIRNVLSDLLDYVDYHFSREETLMERQDYPDYNLHQRMHKRFTQQITLVISQLDIGVDMSAFLLSFLTRWLCDHILGADQKLGAFLKSRFPL
ncbi:Hemerythrin [Azospirillaceae bacterium]